MLTLNSILLVLIAFNLASSSNNQEENSEERSKNTKEDKVNYVRERVLKHFEKEMPSDVESVRTSNWFFERYLQEYNYDEKKSEKAIIEAFDFFHKEELHKVNDQYFPSEAFAVGGLQRFGKSKSGQPLLGVVMNHIKPFGPKLSKSSITKLAEKFCLYQIYKSMFEAKEKNFLTYVVFTNATKDNTEFSLFEKTILAINKYMPGVPQRIYIIGMGKLMEISIKIVLPMLKNSLKKRMLFVDRIEKLEDVISLDEVPVHAGGQNKNFVRIPPGVKSGKCLPHFSYISEKEWDTYRVINTGAIEEGMKEENIDSMEEYLKSCDK